jgi:hypothetical protein
MVTPLKQQDETIKKEDSIEERGKLTVLEDCHFVGSHLDFESKVRNVRPDQIMNFDNLKGMSKRFQLSSF